MDQILLSLLPDLKDSFKDFVGLSDALIHVNVGLVLFLTIAWLLRQRPHGALIAWSIVFGLEIGNEIFDAWVEWGRHHWIDVAETWKDIVATMFWPSILLLIWRPLLSNGVVKASS